MEPLIRYIYRLKLKIKALFLYSSTDVTISKEMYETHGTKHKLLRFRKSNEVTFFSKECDELLVIRYIILGVTFPLQLRVTAIVNVTKTLLVTTKS